VCVFLISRQLNEFARAKKKSLVNLYEHRLPHLPLSNVAQVCCSVLQCVAVCCSVLQRVVVRCSVLQCVAVS